MRIQLDSLLTLIIKRFLLNIKRNTNSIILCKKKLINNFFYTHIVAGTKA